MRLEHKNGLFFYDRALFGPGAALYLYLHTWSASVTKKTTSRPGQRALALRPESTPFKYSDDLHRMLIRRCRSRQDAEDLGQEVYARFLRLSRTIVIEDTEAFLFGVARNVLREYWRAYYTRKTFLVGDAAGAVDESPENLSTAVADSKELSSDLLFQFGKMPTAYRTVLILLLEQQLSYKEVAAEMGVSISSVKAYRRKGLAWLRDHSDE